MCKLSTHVVMPCTAYTTVLPYMIYPSKQIGSGASTELSRPRLARVLAFRTDASLRALWSHTEGQCPIWKLLAEVTWLYALTAPGQSRSKKARLPAALAASARGGSSCALLSALLRDGSRTGVTKRATESW